MSCSLVDRYQHLEERNWLHLQGCHSVLLPTNQVTCHNIIEQCDRIFFFFLIPKMNGSSAFVAYSKICGQKWFVYFLVWWGLDHLAEERD
jgi:hypothetical protein